MTTVADFIKDTLGLIQQCSPNQPVKDADMQTGIRFLNRLMRRTEANGIATGWTPVDNPSDTVPLPEEAELGVMYTLAMMLAPQYGVTPLPSVAAGASLFSADLTRDQAVATPVQPILAVPMPDNGGGYHMGGLINGGYVG